jgi:hypothetical protein
MFDFFKKKKDPTTSAEAFTEALAKGKVGVKDLIAPASVEVLSDAIKIGGLYYKTLFVFDYPRYVHTNWLSPLINFNANLMISLFYYPVDSKQIMEELKVKIGQMEASWQIGQEKGDVRDPELETQMQDANNLRDSIQRGEERFFLFWILLNTPSQDL